VAVPGRKPKPTALKILEGNPGHRPIVETPKPRPIAPECPSWLTDEAKAEWQRVAPALERLGLLTEVDGTALAAYCEAYSRWRAAEEIIAREGLTYENVRLGRIAQHPAVPIARQMMDQIRAYCSEFGLTPSARGRMTLPEVPSGEDDSPFDV
jgi:P27 family predicted phage terminase small subunit